MEKAIRVKFNSSLYSLDSVSKGIEDYKDVADFFVRKKGKSIEVFLSNFSSERRGFLRDEFANYVLFIEGTRRRETAGTRA